MEARKSYSLPTARKVKCEEADASWTVELVPIFLAGDEPGNLVVAFYRPPLSCRNE